MDKINFSGYLDRISPRHFEVLSDALTKQGFGHAEVSIEVVGKAGDNYAADVRRIIAEQDSKVFKMIAKIASTNDMLREMFVLVSLFASETNMYANVLPKYTELENVAEIPVEDRLKYALFCGSCLEEKNEMILLEDLREKGYFMFDRFRSLSNEAVKLVLKTFAMLHGYAYVYRHQQPDTFNSLLNKCVDIWENFGNTEDMKNGLIKMEEDVLQTLNSEKFAKYLRGKMSNLGEFACELTGIDNIDSKYSTVLHGDAWINNILFQVKGDKVSSCCMVDYQLARIGCPAYDIGYMIFSSTDYEMRVKHYHDWIDYYHTELDKILCKFNLKASQVYSRDRLDADLKRYGGFILVQSVFMSTMLVKESRDLTKLKNIMELESEEKDMDKFVEAARLIDSDDKTIELFKKRVKGIIDSHVELGYVEE